MVIKQYTFTNEIYNTECSFCREKKNDCMLIVDFLPAKMFICKDCRALAREYDGTKFWIGHEDVKTPGGRFIPPKERYTTFDESSPKKSPSNANLNNSNKQKIKKGRITQGKISEDVIEDD